MSRRPACALVAGLAATLCIASAGWALTGGVTPGATLDQSYPGHADPCGYIPYPDGWAAQTFTAGITGRLTDVSLVLAGPAPNVAYTVEIAPLDGSGSPIVGSPLASAPLAIPSATGDQQVPASFASGAAVRAGVRYAIVLMRPAADGTLDSSVVWRGDLDYHRLSGAQCPAGAYGGGDALTSRGAIATGPGDFFFSEYVVPAKAAALRLCAKRQRSTSAHPCRSRLRR
jgi:hypothetical protein